MASELLAGMYRVMEGLGAAEKEISSTFLEETGFRKGLEDIGIHDSSFTIEKIQGKIKRNFLILKCMFKKPPSKLD